MIITVVPVVGKINNMQNPMVPAISDKIDQQQPTHTMNTFVMGEAYRAQSFMPTKNKLTRIELFLCKEGTINEDFVVSIRDELHGSDLTTVSKQANQIPTNTQNQDWIEFDFPDLQITSGITYYIVCTAQGGNLDNCYVLGMSDNDPYPSGNAWEYGFFTNYVWEVMKDYQDTPYDLSFKTYCQKAKVTCKHHHQVYAHFLENYSHLFSMLKQLIES